MSKYLLDTNICIYFLNGMFNLKEQIGIRGFENCAISEITIAELKYGIAKSSRREENALALESFQSQIEILPIFPALDVYASEKARLKTKGSIIDDFDLLIGSTAIFHNMVLVTKNISDFNRLSGIVIEDWTVSL